MTKLTILGCGGSAGVPAIGGDWGTCDPANPKNKRSRCAALVQSDTTSIVIDTGPDFREHMNAIALRRPDAVLYTHFHGDHINGIEEMRVIFNRDKEAGRIPLYADSVSQGKIHAKFPHMFIDNDPTGFYPLPIEFMGWQDTDIGKKHRIGDIEVVPLPMLHADITAIGYRFGDVAYCTDVHELPEAAYDILAGVKTLVIDANNFRRKYRVKLHMDLDDVIAANARINAPRVILTHLKNDADYVADSVGLPGGFELAYDGMVIDI